MTSDEAIAIVEKKRRKLKIADSMQCTSVEKAIVQHVRNRMIRSRPKDCVAWIVEMANDTGFVKVYVDDKTGEILEVIRAA